MYDEGADVTVSAAQVAEELLTQFPKDDSPPKKPIGISTGYTALDAYILGLCPGEVTVIGGRTS